MRSDKDKRTETEKEISMTALTTIPMPRRILNGKRSNRSIRILKKKLQIRFPNMQRKKQLLNA